jgi:hypothetical protein
MTNAANTPHGVRNATIGRYAHPRVIRDEVFGRPRGETRTPKLLLRLDVINQPSEGMEPKRSGG